MAPSKLSESDKLEILDLYRQVGETTSTLANRYGVSNTTISRLLKNSLSEEEYEALIQQKRSTRSTWVDAVEVSSPPGIEQLELDAGFEADVETEDEDEEELEDEDLEDEDLEDEEEEFEDEDLEDEDETTVESSPREAPVEAVVVKPPQLKIPAPIRRLNKPASVSETIEPAVAAQAKFLELAPPIAKATSTATPLDDYGAEATVVEEMLGEDLLDQDGDLLDLDDESEDDDLEDDLDDDLDENTLAEEDGEADFTSVQIRADAFIKVLPLTEAFIPRTCYLVIDRTAELVARPLREFADLGQIPAGEIQARTLPVFDNHRVAKRFSNRTQRVIKVPDGRVLQKASSHLQAKGITRLLIDGQVYALN